jgi:glycosyltransferase involved in cell wall biosynthesis
LRILQISASYKPAYIYGGPIMSVSMLAEQLTFAGISSDVFTTTANGKKELAVEVAKPIIIDGVSVTYFNRLTKDHTQFSPSLLIHVWRKAKDYDIIHVHAWWNLAAVLSCLIAMWRKVPVVVSPRGTLSSYSFGNKNNIFKALIHNLITRPLLKNCFIHTTSENEYQSVQKIIKTKSFFKIPNFIRLGHNKTHIGTNSSNYLKIIFLSRIEEKKGLDILLNALANVTVPYRLSIVGDGNTDYVNSLKALAEKNNINEYIDWLGFRGEDKFDLLEQHDLFVLPSYDENFGNVIIESLSVGTAVLIGKNVGLSDFVTENKLGWLCDTNVASVSDAINNISTYQTELVRIKKEAPDKILKNFDANNLVKKYIDMYNQIINKPK